MAYLNKVILIGNAGKDPETGSTPSGALIHEQTDWHNIVCWGKLANVCTQYVCKGSSLCVEGSISYRSWDDKTTGQKRYITEIIANNIQLLGSRPQQQDVRPEQNQQPQSSDDDIPF